MTPSLGRLPLQPAAGALELLADPVAAVVPEVIGSDAYVAEIDPDHADTATLTQTYDLPVAVSANCVIVLGRRGGEQKSAGCVVLADTRVDVNGVVRRQIDVRKCSFAPQEFATEQTGMEFGGITPIGLPDGWPLLVDRRVAETEWIVIGSGLRRSKLVVRGASLAKLPGALVLDDLGS